MKNIILFFATVFFPIAVVAQDCTTYMYLDNNGNFQFTQFDNSGVKGLTINYRVSGVQQIPGGMSSHVLSVIRDKSGKVVDSVSGNYKCQNGKLYVDMRASMPSMKAGQFKGMQVKADESYLEYPSQMSVGESLPDGSFHMEFLRNGNPFVSIDYVVTNRKVEDEEMITTPAGSWNCFHITTDATVKMNMNMGMGMEMPPMSFKIVEWFAPGFGIVKSEDFNKNDELAGTMALTSISK